MDNYVTANVIDNDIGFNNVVYHEKSIKIFYPCVSNVICTPYKLIFKKGTYRIELWGAQGGNMTEHFPGRGGKGGFVVGDIVLKQDSDFFLYLGGVGSDWVRNFGPFLGGFNGGGSTNGGAGAGGGASDMRYNISDLYSRIIVAGGGGGSNDNDNGGFGGGVFGGDGNFISNCKRGKGGTQTNGGSGFVDGKLGYGGGSETYDDGGAGGGGYFGGGKGESYLVSGGGGSAYISGHFNCNSVEKDPNNNPISTNNPIHPSGYAFNHTSILSGSMSFLSPTGFLETGHIGAGACTITLLSIMPTQIWIIDYSSIPKLHLIISLIGFIFFFSNTYP